MPIPFTSAALVEPLDSNPNSQKRLSLHFTMRYQQHSRDMPIG
jgi:hypothetical protein